MTIPIPIKLPVDPKIPVLKGFVDGRDIRVWCPYCRVFHNHMALDTYPTSKGYRSAQCLDSPFNETGYYVRAFTEKEKVIDSTV